MREKIRQKIVENPRAMDGAYALMLAGVFLWEVSILGNGAEGP